MKTYLTYGFGITLAGALVTLLLFVLGYHSDPAKLQSSQTIQGIIGLAIGITGLVLGMRDLRNQSADGSLSFGRAVGAGVLIFLFAGIFGAIFQLIYGLVINPSYHEIIYQAQVNAMEAKGMPSAQIEQSEKFIRFFTGPIAIAIWSIIGTPIIGAVLSMIVGAFMKRAPAPSAVPPLPAV